MVPHRHCDPVFSEIGGSGSVSLRTGEGSSGTWGWWDDIVRWWGNGGAWDKECTEVVIR